MKKINHPLIDELRSEGASEEEAHSLAQLANELSTLNGWRPHLHIGVAGSMLLAGSLAALSFIVLTLSLGSLPGQPLHPLKVAAESVAVVIDPAIQTDVMMDRSWEVERLASSHKPSGQVLAALADYNQKFRVTKTGDHYAAWAFCSRELQKAKDATSGSTQQAIDQSLQTVAAYQS